MIRDLNRFRNANNFILTNLLRIKWNLCEVSFGSRSCVTSLMKLIWDGVAISSFLNLLLHLNSRMTFKVSINNSMNRMNFLTGFWKKSISLCPFGLIADGSGVCCFQKQNIFLQKLLNLEGSSEFLAAKKGNNLKIFLKTEVFFFMKGIWGGLVWILPRGIIVIISVFWVFLIS